MHASRDLLLVLAVVQCTACAELVTGLPHDARQPSQVCASAAQSALACEGCHGTGGHSSGAVPSLPAIGEEAFVRRLRELQVSADAGLLMPRMLSGLKDENLRAIAAYYGGGCATQGTAGRVALHSGTNR